MVSRRRSFLGTGLAVAVWLLTAWPALAQEGREGGLRPQEFGTTEEVVYNIHPTDFQVALATSWVARFDLDNHVGAAPGVAGVSLSAPIHLPDGVRITSVRLYYYDNYPGSEPYAVLHRNTTSDTVESVTAPFSFPSFSGGYSFLDGTVNPGLATVDNENYHYSFSVDLHRSVAGTNLEERLLRVRIRYVRQVSPAPQSATFGDVSTAHPQHRFIEALVAAGITAGCGGGNYCPDTPITRGQMAVFLSTALGLHWP